MPRSGSPLQEFTGRTQGWVGGVNARDAVASLSPDEARRMENGILDEAGGFNKRLGTTSQGTFGVGADRILSMYTYFRGVSAPQILIHTSAGKLYYTSDPTANPIVWTLIVGSLSSTVPLSFETFAGNCYMSNGVDDYAKWDGAARTAFPTAPKGKYLRLWKDTMFLAGVTGLPDRVYESAAGDAENWPVAGWIDIAKGDGDRVTALGTDGFTLIVFKQRRHMAITDPVSLANRVVDSEKGCESHFSVIQFAGTVYFLSRRGICRYLGDSPSDLVSFKLDPIFDPAVINLAALETAWAYTVENRVGWALPEVGIAYPTFQIEYYPRLGRLNNFGTRAIGPWTFMRMPGRNFTQWRWQGNERLFAGAQDFNRFYWCLSPIGTDDGTMFTAILETGPFDFGAPNRDKYVRRVFLVGRGRFYFQTKRNFGPEIRMTKLVDLATPIDLWSTADVWGDGTWGPSAIIKEQGINTDLYGRVHSFVFVDAETSTNQKLLDVGTREFIVDAGEWGIYQAVFEGSIMGVRT